jgi:hypothetical protein
LATNKNSWIKKHWPSGRKEIQVGKITQKGAACGSLLGTSANSTKQLGTSREVESRTKVADMAIGVCRQCLLSMPTHTRHSNTACSTTPARVRSTAPRAHTLPVPSVLHRARPLSLPVNPHHFCPALDMRSSVAGQLQSAVRLCRFAALLPSVAPFALHCSRPSLARCCAAFLPPVSIAAAQCPRDSSSLSALELHYKDSAGSRQSLQFYFLSPRHSIRCCRSRSCNS